MTPLVGASVSSDPSGTTFGSKPFVAPRDSSGGFARQYTGPSLSSGAFGASQPMMGVDRQMDAIAVAAANAAGTSASNAFTSNAAKSSRDSKANGSYGDSKAGASNAVKPGQSSIDPEIAARAQAAAMNAGPTALNVAGPALNPGAQQIPVQPHPPQPQPQPQFAAPLPGAGAAVGTGDHPPGGSPF